MKAGGSGPNAKQSYLETKEQRLSGVVVEEGRVDVHLGFNMLMDAACEEDRETGLVCVCLCLCVWRWIYLSLRAMCAPSMLQLRSLQLISPTSGLPPGKQISLCCYWSPPQSGPGEGGRLESSPCLLKQGGDTPEDWERHKQLQHSPVWADSRWCDVISFKYLQIKCNNTLQVISWHFNFPPYWLLCFSRPSWSGKSFARKVQIHIYPLLKSWKVCHFIKCDYCFLLLFFWGLSQSDCLSFTLMTMHLDIIHWVLKGLWWAPPDCDGALTFSLRRMARKFEQQMSHNRT